MAVYTHITQETLQDFLPRYALGDLHRLEGIREGVENTNYRLQTAQGHFILTIFEDRTPAEDLPYFIELMRHAAGKDIPCPHPIGDRSGEILKTIDGKPVVIFTELSGAAELEPGIAQCGEVGRLLGRFHRAAEDFSGKRDNALGLAGWRPLIEEIGNKADKIEPRLAQELRDELDFIEHHWPRHLPQGTIHADLIPQNVLWQGKELTGMIDFYFSCNDILAYDLAICLNAWCFASGHTQMEAQHAKAMIEGYETFRPLNHAEHDALSVLCRGAALRFLTTRLHDLFFTPAGALVTKKDPSEYLRKNRYFRVNDLFAA
ncbi:MAG: homoserine kinase [Pseudomonadota bacterium]